mgnify:CR=1 FL=1
MLLISLLCVGLCVVSYTCIQEEIIQFNFMKSNALKKIFLFLNFFLMPLIICYHCMIVVVGDVEIP